MQPRKVVGRLRVLDPLKRLEELNRFVTQLRPRAKRGPNPLKDGSWPVRKRVGRPEPR